MKYNYFAGQSKILTIGQKNFAYVSLINPTNSNIEIFIDKMYFSNYSNKSFLSQIWLCHSTSISGEDSSYVSSIDLRYNLKAKGILKCNETESCYILSNGVNVINRIIPGGITLDFSLDEKFVIPSGKSFIVMLKSPINQVNNARVSFLWKETSITSPKIIL